MSLKNVHVLFIVAATVLALFCAVQAFDRYQTDGSMLAAVAGAAAVLAAGLLVRYETLFLKRCRLEGIR